MNSEMFTETLSALPFSKVSIGLTTIHLFSEDEISDGQLGYSIAPNGDSLAGENEGDWKESWLVIGYDETCGDPIFMDLNIQGFPIYTAIHGMGDWRGVQIADNFRSFCESLKIITELSVGRENPVLLEKNPISSEEKQQGMDKIRALNPESDLEFWELTLRDY